MAGMLRRYQSEIYGNYRLAYLTYGILTGVLLAIAVSLQHCLAPSSLTSPENYVTDSVVAVAIFVACYRYRSLLPDRKVMLKELLLLGMGIALISSLVYGLWIWLMGAVFAPDMVDAFIQHRISAIATSSDDLDAAKAVELTKAYTAADWGFIGGFRLFVISIIFVFFAAIIFRTEKSPLKTSK